MTTQPPTDEQLREHGPCSSCNHPKHRHHPWHGIAPRICIDCYDTPDRDDYSHAYQAASAQPAAPLADEQHAAIRAEILAALSAAGAFCGDCGFEPGEIGCSDCVRVREMYADALTPITARLRAELEQARAQRDAFLAQRDNLRNLVLAECDAIDAEVYGQHDEDDDGKREATARIRAAVERWRRDIARAARTTPTT